MRQTFRISLITISLLLAGCCSNIKNMQAMQRESPSVVQTDAEESNSTWYSEMLGIDIARSQYGLTGKGVTIAVIDSGISFTDKELAEKVIASYDFSDGLEKVDGHPVLESDHGTNVASILVSETTGVAPGVNLIDFNVAVGREKQKVSGSGAIKAFRKIIELLDAGTKIDIVQMSFGFNKPSEIVRKLLGEIASRGVILVSSAGNRGRENPDEQIQYPAAYDDVIAVGSIEPTKVRAESSSFGSFVDIVAPGEGIDVLFRDGEFGYASGTSMASPMVSGILALYKEAYPSASKEELIQMLYENAEDLGSEGKDDKYGYGLVSAIPPEHHEMNKSIHLDGVYRLYGFANVETAPSLEMVLSGNFMVTKMKGWLDSQERFAYFYLKDLGWIQTDETFDQLELDRSSFAFNRMNLNLYEALERKSRIAVSLDDASKLYTYRNSIKALSDEHSFYY